MFQRLFGRERSANRAISEALYASIVAAARQPAFYSDWNVPDTPLGRFEMLSLHMFLFQHRMGRETGASRDVAQILIDNFFEDVDHSLRELGIGDMGIPKRMKKLARMYYGRTAAYDDALERGDREALAAALARNIRPDAENWPEAAKLADYVVGAVEMLAAQDSEAIRGGLGQLSGASTGLKEASMHEEQDKSPVSFNASVARLPQKGMPVIIDADARQRKALAEAHGLVSVERFHAELLVAPWKRNGVKVSGHVEADITQECVVTLDPLQAKIEETVEGLFLPEDSKLGRLGFEGGGEIHIDAEGPDSPETFSGDSIDVGALGRGVFRPRHRSVPAESRAPATPGKVEDDASSQPEGPLQEKLRQLSAERLNRSPGRRNRGCAPGQNRYFAQLSPALSGPT